MAKSRKILVNASLFILLVMISGFSFSCSQKKDTKKTIDDIRVGTDGISVNFLANNPPATVHAESNLPNNFDVIVELANKGVYPQPDEATALKGKVFLSGFDTNILDFSEKSIDLGKKQLSGKSLVNPIGSSDIGVFKGKVPTIILDNLKVDKYEPTLLATLCYHYQTIAGPSVCIDPDPYTTVKQKKVCEASPVTLTSQGAPVAVVKVDEEAFSTNTQFKITIKNVGNGDVIRDRAEAFANQPSGSNPYSGDQSVDPVDRCDPFGASKLGREDIDKVYVEEVSVGQTSLICWPFTDTSSKSPQGFIRLLNGEGSVICELQKTDSGYPGGKTAYSTPLKIVLDYVYKTTADRKVLIQKESIGK